MRRISNLIDLRQVQQQTHSNHGQRRQEESIQLIREAFGHMRNAYGEQFAPLRRQPKDSEEKYQARVHRSLDTWAAALAHLSPAEIRIGVTRCIREVKFGDRVTPADIVTRATLSPAELGLPDARVAFKECVRNMLLEEGERKWSSGVVYHAAQSVSGNPMDWKMQTEPALWSQFEHTYAMTCKRYMLGEEMAAPIARALTAKPEEKKTDRASVRKVCVDTAEKISNPQLRAAMRRAVRADE
jgi:hypothetical protein